ncbi:Uncharacterised protein [Vibrio cholerae]|nr:Uncharacterised protein [Vibrio cholerae]
MLKSPKCTVRINNMTGQLRQNRTTTRQDVLSIKVHHFAMNIMYPNPPITTEVEILRNNNFPLLLNGQRIENRHRFI